MFEFLSVKESFGTIGDLQKQLQSVVWVTVFRTCQISDKFKDGQIAITRALLSGNMGDVAEFERRIREMEFLKDMIPLVRKAKSKAARNGDTFLIVDILRWSILDAAEMSNFQRMKARFFAVCDSMYKHDVPMELL